MRWEEVVTTGRARPGKRWGHSLSSVSYGKFLYLFGGYGKNDSQTNDVYIFDSAKISWSKAAVSGQPPAPRDSHTCTAVGSKLFVFGGTDGNSPLADLHVLDTTTNTWTQPVISGEAPEPREGHSATLNGDHLYVFGGCGRGVKEHYYNDLFALNTTTFEWKEVVASGTTPAARDSHSLSSYENKLIVFGGEDSLNAFLADVYVLDLDVLKWKKLETFGLNPSPRAGHTAELIGSNLFVFGGFSDQRKLFHDVYFLDILAGVWTKAVTTGSGPSPRFSLNAALVDAEKGVLVFYGGCNQDLEALSEMYYLHTDMGSSLQDQSKSKGNVSLRMDLRRRRRVSRPQPSHTTSSSSEDQAEEEEDERPVTKKSKPVSALLSPVEVEEDSVPSPYNTKPVAERIFEAKLTEVFNQGYKLEATIDGKEFRGVLFSSKSEFIEGVSSSFITRNEELENDSLEEAEDTPIKQIDHYFPTPADQQQPLVLPEHYRELLGSSNNPFLNNLACLP